MTIVWTDYLIYRAQTRGFDQRQLENILRFSAERYYDTETGRSIAIGRHHSGLVMIAFEQIGGVITPITVHAITRQQIRYRLQTERFRNE